MPGTGMLLLETFRKILPLVGGHGWRLVDGLRPWLAPDRPVVAEVEGHRMLLDLRLPYDWRLFKSGIKDTEDYLSFCSSVRPGATVVDIGARIGVFTLAAARLAGANGQVIAFDPLPRNCRHLLANAALNGYDNIAVEQMALGDHDGQMDINPTSRDNATISDVFPPMDGQGKQKVACRRLDSYLGERGIGHVGLIKIDVEGAEAFVVDGMENLLKGPRLPTLVVEVHTDLLQSVGRDACELLRRLASAGYDLHHLRTRRGRLEETPMDVEKFEIPKNRPFPYNRFFVRAMQK